MPNHNRALSRAVRAGMSTTGLSYTQQREQVLQQQLREHQNDEAARDAYDDADYDDRFADVDIDDDDYDDDDDDYDGVLIWCGECGATVHYECSC